MKKLTKAALLAAATAFMLAGVTACGHDDTPPLVVGSTGGSGNGGTEQGSGNGGTEQGSGSGGTEQGGGSGGTEQGGGSGGTEQGGGSGGTEQGGGSGDTEQGGSGSGDTEQGDTGEEEKAEVPIPFTGSFIGLNGATFGLDEPLAQGTTTNLEGTIRLIGDGITATLYSKSSGNLRVRAGDASLSTGINYNGTSMKNSSTKLPEDNSDVTISDLSRWISVSSVPGSKTLTVSYTTTISDKGSEDSKIVLLDRDGKVLTTEVINTTTTAGMQSGEISTQIESETDVYIIFSREGAGGGGIDVTAVKISE